jgi:hypothetical protein
MKQLFTMALGIVIIFLAACNNGSQTSGQQTKSDTTVIPENLTGEKSYDHRFPGAFEKTRETVREEFRIKRRPDTSLLSAPLQLTFAREYVQAFPQGFTSLARGTTGGTATPLNAVQSLNTQQMGTFFDFNDTTLEALLDLYKAKQIDGIRVYMAKYTGDRYDFRNAGLSRYTVILVGTKETDGIPVDQFIRSAINPDLMKSVQDYTNPCTPSPCPAGKGALLLQNP